MIPPSVPHTKAARTATPIPRTVTNKFEGEVKGSTIKSKAKAKARYPAIFFILLIISTTSLGYFKAFSANLTADRYLQKSQSAPDRGNLSDSKQV